jgi:hypothetical protein
MVRASKHLRAVLLVCLTALYLPANLETLTSAPIPWCDQVCDEEASCGTVCKVGYGEGDIITCGDYNGGPPTYCSSGGGGCTPNWGPWTYESTVATRHVTFFHWEEGHTDCYREQLDLVKREDTQCGSPDQYACSAYTVFGTLIHDVSDCSVYYQNLGTWECPY